MSLEEFVDLRIVKLTSYEYGVSYQIQKIVLNFFGYSRWVKASKSKKNPVGWKDTFNSFEEAKQSLPNYKSIPLRDRLEVMEVYSSEQDLTNL